MCVLPCVISSGGSRPQSKRGRSTTRMRGEPDSSLTRRISVVGRNMRPRFQKRGARSVTSMPCPCSSYRRVRSTAVLGSYSCSERAKFSSSKDHRLALSLGSSSASNTGSPSKRGRQHQTMPPRSSISALKAQLPMTPSFSDGSGRAAGLVMRAPFRPCGPRQAGVVRGRSRASRCAATPPWRPRRPSRPGLSCAARSRNRPRR